MPEHWRTVACLEASSPTHQDPSPLRRDLITAKDAPCAQACSPTLRYIWRWQSVSGHFSREDQLDYDIMNEGKKENATRIHVPTPLVACASSPPV